ncbi:polygalacturonase inhibitor [Phtheirospermum japonicum]|uniref:Polygalacturonase inhibitor n=1 Tax=Phtheirospermum japonicum TaxID=374723 RepID=A0A830C7H5_9LAMI|nr:polygalacturonase inhibitor [Phtheirospermum japonicum]
MKITTFICILFLSQPLLSHSERCNPQDKKVLLKIKQAFNNPYHLASWDPATDCCGWYVVECDRITNRINEIHLFSANVSGQIPAAVADLPYLESLTFHKITNLTGTIPRALTRLRNLKRLTISWTNISGPIPTFLSELKSLTSHLSGLRLDRNKLTGPIPDSFGDLSPTLQYLYLSHNQLSGSIPRAWGYLNFTLMSLERNKLEGDISFLNTLMFNMSNVEIPDSLTNLDLNHNRIYGSLPEGLANWERLFNMNVSYNRLCGRIPIGGKLQELDYTSYFHNRCLCGKPLPDCK